MLDGKYFFFDDLELKEENWEYCTIKDRRFFTEVTKGLRPEGKTLITNDIAGMKEIPEGTYDIGDGYYDPLKRMICEYDGQFKRELNFGEESWIIEKCRYRARKFDDDVHLDGKEDKIIKEMVKLNQNPQLKQARESKGNKP